MGYWIDDDTYQCHDKREMMGLLGLDPDTIQGDYAEAMHALQKEWNKVEIDVKFEDV
jgi:hypothetical protein